MEKTRSSKKNTLKKETSESSPDELKKEEDLEKKVEDLQERIDYLARKLENVEEKIELLAPTLSRFLDGLKLLKNLLSSQKYLLHQEDYQESLIKTLKAQHSELEVDPTLIDVLKILLNDGPMNLSKLTARIRTKRGKASRNTIRKKVKILVSAGILKVITRSNEKIISINPEYLNKNQ